MDEPVEIGRDMEPHPRSSMDSGAEFLTKRPLRVKLVETLAAPD